MISKPCVFADICLFSSSPIVVCPHLMAPGAASPGPDETPIQLLHPNAEYEQTLLYSIYKAPA